MSEPNGAAFEMKNFGCFQLNISISTLTSVRLRRVSLSTRHQTKILDMEGNAE
jgi:hypothetical protein